MCASMIKEMNLGYFRLIIFFIELEPTIFILTGYFYLTLSLKRESNVVCISECDFDYFMI